MDYRIGMIIEGEVTGIQPYGAFISLKDGNQGLIHISEVKHGYIKSISEVLTVGQKVTVKVVDIDEFTQKISLSLRTLEKMVQSNSNKRKKYFTNKNKHIGFETLKEEMPIWIDEALNELINK